MGYYVNPSADAFVNVLRDGNYVDKSELISYNDMTSIRGKDDVFTLLVHFGYLAYDSGKKEVFIPNEEVRGEFVRAVSEGRRPELAKAVKIADELLAAMLAGDETKVAGDSQEV